MTSNKVDESLYSRQLFVYGVAAQERIQLTNVLVTGILNGSAIEVCKSLALAGVRSITLCDDAPCQVGDLASSYVINENCVRDKRIRSQVALQYIAELNQHVSCEAVSKQQLDATGFDRFQIVVVVNEQREVLEKIGLYCHNKSIPVVFIGTYGLYGYCFCDFGPEFTILDNNGEQPKEGIVIGMSTDPSDENRILVSTSDDKNHGLEDGDLVKFVSTSISYLDGDENVFEIRIPGEFPPGMSGQTCFSIAVESPATIQYEGGGYYQQVKAHKKVSFRDFSSSLKDPNFVMNYWDDVSMPNKLHGYLLGLWEFQKHNNGMLPRPGSTEDATQVVHYITNISTNSPLDAALVEKLAKGASGQLCALSTIIGGIAAQEVIKACTNRFTPIHQWIHISAVECACSSSSSEDLPTREELLSHDVSNPLMRYAGQAAVIGWDTQRKIMNTKTFIVGAGALGCETLKNFALMGISCRADSSTSMGSCTVTDLDAIEHSNLNRQFLFRPHHIGQMKSTVAAKAVQAINPQLSITALEHKVAPETESIFDDSFWADKDVIVNALDNITARLYVDTKCVFHAKPLMESGTLGTKANTLPVIPNLTESYGTDPPKDDSNAEIPACTLHAYPNEITHTIAWARDAVFEHYFKQMPMEAAVFLRHQHEGTMEKYYRELDAQPSTKITRLQAVRGALIGILPQDSSEKTFPYEVNTSPMTFDVCVRLARYRFEELFVNKIKLLLHAHPNDKVVDESGTPFWSGRRRAPRVEEFDIDDPLHFLFVKASVMILAQVYGISLPVQHLQLESHIRQSLVAIGPLPEYQCDGSVAVPVDDKEAKLFEKRKLEESAQNVDSAQDEIEKLSAKSLVVSSIHPQSFSKDDDSNGHVDLIYAASSIRARSYRIPLVDKLRTKMIVGRIVPAIATTTAVTTGFMALEFIKCIQNKPLAYFRCTNFNMAVNSYASFEPTPCKVTPFGKPKYVREHNSEKMINISMWTMVHLTGDMTVQEILDYFLDRFEFEISQLSTTGDVVLFNDLFDNSCNVDDPISKVFEEAVGQIPPKYIMLAIDGDFEEDSQDGDDIDDDFTDTEPVFPQCRIEWQI